MARKAKGGAKKSAGTVGVTSTPVGRQNVILERMEEQQRVVIEAVTSNREALERQIHQLDQKLSSRIDVLEIAVRQNGTDIRQNTADLRQASADIRKNSADIQSVSDKLDTKADTSRVASLEGRIGAIESPSA